MDTPPAKEPRHFWASASAVKVIRDALGNPDWKPTSGQEAWETLRDEIVALNSKGRFKPFNAPKQVINGRETYLLIDGQPLPEKEDWVTMKPELCRRLAIVARLLQLFRRRLLTRLGKHKGMSPEKLAERLRDPRTRTFFDLAYSIGSLDTPMGMNALEKVGREGVTWTLPGGIEQCYRDRDCGIEPMVMATRRAFKLLARSDDKSEADATGPVKPTKRVEVVEHHSLRFELIAAGKKPFTLTDKIALMFAVLYAAYKRREDGHQGWVPYLTLLKAMWPEKLPDASPDSDESPGTRRNKKPDPDGSVENFVSGTAPLALKRAKADLESAFREILGFPNGNQRLFWIETKKGEAYRLDPKKAVWWTDNVNDDRVDPEHRRGRTNAK